MKRFLLEQSNDELYTSQSGVALADFYINRYSNLSRVTRRKMENNGSLILNIDILPSYLDLLCPGKRRRIKTVIQELIYLTALLIRMGCRLRLRFGCHCPEKPAFTGVYGMLLVGN